METYQIESNGETFSFNVFKNTTESCAECGVPACGKEDVIWYEYNNKRIGIILDGGYFDLALEEAINKALNNSILPNFLKEWKELKGWTNSSDYNNGYELQIEDFLESLELLKCCEMGKWITIEDITDMETLAYKAQEAKSKLRIVRG